MSGTTHSPVTYRFGVFELDLRSGELRRGGNRIRLQDQSFQILQKLLEESGALVTREELRRTLWPADTFVDFDTGLNTAIKRLRETLGDSADVPVFIETIPRRGYRFIAPVTVPGPASTTPANGTNGHKTEHAAELAPSASREGRHGKPQAWLLLTALPLLGVLAGGFAAWLKLPLPEPKITGFTQLTSDGMIKGKVVSDGTRIYFNEMAANRVLLAQVSLSGGEVSILDSGIPGAGIDDISADGSKLMVSGLQKYGRASTPLRVRDVASGVERNLGVMAPDGAVWAPDGHLLISQGSEVWLATADGSSPRKFVTVPGYASAFAFSPDGKRVRFTVRSPTSAVSSLWEANGDGSNVHPLPVHRKGPASECCGSWTPDGKYFVFQSVDEGRSQIWVQREGGTFLHPEAAQPVQLTTGPLQFVGPTISRDGKKLLVLGSQPRAELVRYDEGAGGFVPYLSGMSAGDVETSHDGKSMVYVKYPEGTLWRSAVDGTNRTPLTSLPMQTGLAHWSPDDKRIAFSASKPGLPANIYIVPAEGGVAERVSFGAVADLDASWSPDGRKLTFGGNASYMGDGGVSIQSLDLSTHEMTEVPGSRGICCPRWSPDGRFLVGIGGQYTKLMLFDFATRKWSVMREGIGTIGYTHWAADSKSVTFDTLFTDEPFYYRARVPSGTLERVASLKDVNRFWGRWGSWTGVAPDGSPLFVRDVSNQELYSFDLQVP